MTGAKNTLFVLSGPPRCGKSTWARKKQSQLGVEGFVCPIVSGDAIRRALYQRRFWMPGDKLVRPYAWVMVRSLFVAGHQNVIIDETTLDEEGINFWSCTVNARTPLEGGGKYPALLPVDMIRDKETESERSSATFEDSFADELQGDIIAWRRHVVVFETSLKDCEERAKLIDNYNQRSTLIRYIQFIQAKGWNPHFIENVDLEKTGESWELVNPN